jgi:methyl acetate hydrolase
VRREAATRPEPGDPLLLGVSPGIHGIPMPELLKSADHTLSNDVPALPVPQGWGLGFHLFNADIPAMRSAGSGDWAGIFNCYYWIDRAAGVGAALMTQVLPFFDAAIVQTLLDFEAAEYTQIGSPAAT